MFYDKVSDKYVFTTTGRTEEANCGIIGIGPKLNLADGWDGGFINPVNGELTLEERAELSLFMIRRWSDYAEFGTRKDNE
jgi:hypothetical protein